MFMSHFVAARCVGCLPACATLHSADMPPGSLRTHHSPVHLVFSLGLLYNFRHFERLLGSNKFSLFLLLAGLTGSGVLLAAQVAGLAHPLTGPTLLLFALFPLYMRLVPRRVPAQFTLLGISFSDKAMVYLAGLQLAFADGAKSLLPAVVGTVLGALYLANVAGVGAARWPAALHSTAEAAFLPVLGEEHPSRVAARRAAARAQRERQQLQAQAMAMARQGGARGEQLRALQAMLAAQGGPGAEGGGGGVPMGGTGGGPTPPPPMPRVEPDEAAVQQLMAMGFDRAESEAALAATGNNADAAAARLLGD